MPNSHYSPANEPPSLWDRILAHAFPVGLSVCAIGFAALLLSSLHPEVVVSRSLSEVSWFTIALLAAALLVSAGSTLRGILFVRPEWLPTDTLKVRYVGSAVTALVWWAFSISVLFSGNPYGIATLWITGCIGASFALHGYGLWASRRRILLRVAAERTLER